MESGGSVMGYYDECIDKSFTDQEPPSKPCSSNSAAPPDVSTSTTNTCFDCSICLDYAVEPVVTLCGHLYCWPCLYKWLQVEPTPSSRHCPVCKSPLSQNTLVPLYGRGDTKKIRNLNIPNRPTVVKNEIAHLVEEEEQQLHRRNNHQHRHQYYYSSSPWDGSGTSVFSSTAGGVLGGLAIAILPLVTRNGNGGGMPLSRLHGFDSAGTGLGSIQRRRQERRVEEGLHQLWVFLFCCFVLCLLLF